VFVIHLSQPREEYTQGGTEGASDSSGYPRLGIFKDLFQGSVVQSLSDEDGGGDTDGPNGLG
jgi:hypothetical protein